MMKLPKWLMPAPEAQSGLSQAKQQMYALAQAQQNVLAQQQIGQGQVFSPGQILTASDLNSLAARLGIHAAPSTKIANANVEYDPATQEFAVSWNDISIRRPTIEQAIKEFRVAMIQDQAGANEDDRIDRVVLNQTCIPLTKRGKL